MSGHTPGPYKRDGRFVYASTEYRMPSGGTVEVNRFSASVSPGHECSPEEAEAVAVLFQAAPELLAACKAALLVMDDGRTEDLVHAAIAKATGEGK